jgi:hypothetical protein
MQSLARYVRVVLPILERMEMEFASAHLAIDMKERFAMVRCMDMEPIFVPMDIHTWVNGSLMKLMERGQVRGRMEIITKDIMKREKLRVTEHFTLIMETNIKAT